MTLPDTETVVKTWLSGTVSAQSALKRPDGGVNVFLAMPKANPNPVILLRLVSGGPTPRKDLPQHTQRFHFDVIGRSRGEAVAIMLGVCHEMDQLGRDGPGPLISGVYLASIQVQSMRWLPDPDSDIPRYVVDALVTTIA